MKCAVYTRVSTDKEEQKASLANQKDLFLRYISERNWDLYEIYTDVQTGTKDKKRTAFKRMLEDAENKKFDIILAKELSRLARNGSLSYKIRDLAEQKNLHIVTLDNAINTINGDVSKFGLYAWLYENESQTTSRRVKYALDNRAKKGLFKGSIPPYGYFLENGKLCIRDDNTPDIVRRIFREYLEGFGQDLIAKKLYSEGIPTPSMIAKKSNSNNVWHGSTVMKILTNQSYTGDLVQSKTCTVSVTSTKRKLNKEKDFIIVENNHDSIISKDEFNAVHLLIQSRRRLKKTAPQAHLFTNILFCEDCGHGMHYKYNRRGYVCGSYDKFGKIACTDHIVREEELTSSVLHDIKQLIKNVKTDDFKTNIEKKLLLKQKKLEKNIEKLNLEIDKYKQRKINALSKFADSYISKEEYDLLVADINLNLAKLAEQQQEHLSFITNQSDVNNSIKNIAKMQDEVLNITKLSRDILNRFVEKIKITKDGTARVYYRFSILNS